MTKTNQNSFNPIIYFFVCLFVMIGFDLTLTNHIIKNIFITADNSKFIDIVYVQNTGAAFSSFQHLTWLLVVFAIFAVLFIIYELFRDPKKYTPAMYFATAMLASGVICNTYERISFGFVRDFINLKFIEFPVFNISDILINLGVLVIIILVPSKKYKRYDKTDI